MGERANFIDYRVNAVVDWRLRACPDRYGSHNARQRLDLHNSIGPTDEDIVRGTDRTGRYNVAVTPSTGTETVFHFYRSVLGGTAAAKRDSHAVF